MGVFGWLAYVPERERRWLLGGTAGLLLLGTAFVHPQHDVVALILLIALALGWAGVWWRLARPERARVEAARRAAQEQHAEDLGRIVAGAVIERGGLAALTTTDPAFSLPVLDDVLRALHRASCESAGPPGPWDHAPPRVVSVARDGGRTSLVAEVRARGSDGTVVCRRLHLWRTAARSPAPHLLTNPGWKVERWEPAEPGPGEPASVDPAMPAARRALLVREAFDLAAFDALVEQIDRALDAAGATPAAPDAYTTGGGAESVRFWVRTGGLPPSGSPTRWLSVEEDGWYHRIEVQRGERVLGLLRPSTEAAAPWRLWRVRRASG